MCCHREVWDEFRLTTKHLGNMIISKNSAIRFQVTTGIRNMVNLRSILTGVCGMFVLAVPITYGETGIPAPKPFVWTVKAPPQRLVLLLDRQTSFAVSTGEIGATNVRIAYSNLQDATTGGQLGSEHLQLCLPGATSCGTSISIDPYKTQRILLQVAPTFLFSGTFAGSISLAVDQKVEMDSFDLTVLSTSLSNQILGAALILAGIMVSWFVSVFIRQRALRAEALMPASELGDALRRLIADTERAHKKSENRLPKTLDRLKALLASLAPEQLEANGLIPQPIPNPFKATPDPTGTYKQFLTNLSNEVTALSVVIRDGIRRVMEKLDGQNHGEAVPVALQKLDTLAEQVSTADEAKVSVAKIRGELEDALANGIQRGIQATPPIATPPVSTVPSLQELLVQQSRLSISVWLIWGGLTWLVGVVALVATNYGFGAGLDYFKCFLWGLGVQVAGNQLQQLTPTAVSTTFSISFPKA